MKPFVIIERSVVKFARGCTTILCQISHIISALAKLLDIMSRFNETQRPAKGKMGLSTGLKQIVQADWPYATGPTCTMLDEPPLVLEPG